MPHWLAYAFHFVFFASIFVAIGTVTLLILAMQTNLLHVKEGEETIFFHAKSNGIIFYYDMILNETARGQKLRILFDLNRFRFLYGVTHPFFCSHSPSEGFHSIRYALAQYANIK